MSLQTTCLLADLDINRPPRRARSRKAEGAVREALDAEVRATARLGQDDLLDAIHAALDGARDDHYRLTLPWTDRADRLLPVRLLQEYEAALQARQAEVSRLAEGLTEEWYAAFLAAEAQRLRGVYDRDNYPATVSGYAAKIGCRVRLSPVPGADDVRVTADEATLERVRQSVEAGIRERETVALGDATQRLVEGLKRVVTVLRADKPRVYETLLGELTDLVKTLPQLNVWGDETLQRAVDEASWIVAGTSTEQLRNSPAARAETAAAAAATLRRIEGVL